MRKYLLFILLFFLMSFSFPSQAIEVKVCLRSKEQIKGYGEAKKKYLIPAGEKLPATAKYKNHYEIFYANQTLKVRAAHVEEIPLNQCFAFDEKKRSRKRAEILVDLAIYHNQSAGSFSNIIQKVRNTDNVGSLPDPLVPSVGLGTGHSISICNRIPIAQFYTNCCLGYMEEYFKILQLSNPYIASDNRTILDLTSSEKEVKFKSIVLKLNGSFPFQMNEFDYLGIGLGFKSNYYFEKDYQFNYLTGSVWKNTLGDPIVTGPKSLMTKPYAHFYYEHLTSNASVLKKFIFNVEFYSLEAFGLSLLFGI